MGVHNSASKIIIILLPMLLILPLASNSVMANSNDVELVITFGEPNSDGDWFIENESLSISIEILNNAQNTRSIEYNPSCPVEIEMFDNNEGSKSSDESTTT